MKIEEINADRQVFLQKVNEAVSGELEKIGLALINVNIRDTEAVHAETDANAKKVSHVANQRVAEESARNKFESAAREADGAIRVAREFAEKKAEDAKSEREQARLNAEVVVPANAEREKVIIAADARREQSIRASSISRRRSSSLS